MATEIDAVAVVAGLVSGRCYPDTAPVGVLKPYVVYQSVGGRPINPINGDDPGSEFARIQFNAWADTRAAANALMRDIVAALRASPVSGRPIGGLIARYDETGKLRGAQQDIEFQIQT
jgi:hypothetical protein